MPHHQRRGLRQSALLSPPSLATSARSLAYAACNASHLSSLAASARNVAYSACNASIWASICHWKNPRHVGSCAWSRTFLRDAQQDNSKKAIGAVWAQHALSSLFGFQ
jgi:hypothetical protein